MVASLATSGGVNEMEAGARRGDRAMAWRDRWAVPPARYSTETKPFFLTSEFLVYVLFLMGLAIGAGTSDTVDARLFWILATVATSFYMLSRGIAKSGTRSRAYDPREDIEIGRDR